MYLLSGEVCVGIREPALIGWLVDGEDHNVADGVMARQVERCVKCAVLSGFSQLQSSCCGKHVNRGTREAIVVMKGGEWRSVTSKVMLLTEVFPGELPPG